MKIDTLVLSGGSTKVPIYVGIFKALQSLDIINKDLDGINHIITCSIGMLFSIYILLDIPLYVQEKAILLAEFSNLLDMETINIQSLLIENGLFSNSKIASLVKGILLEKYKKEDMTLKELYDIKPILLTVKCINITKSCNEYINVHTDPNISILSLLLMTTAIPIFFKPIEYNNYLYVDGGLTGGYPIELVKDNYLGFNIEGPTDALKLSEDIPFINFIIDLLKVKVMDYDTLSLKNTITYNTDVPFSEFNLTLDKKKELIQLGYDITIQHCKTYNIINDNLHHMDLTPTGVDPDS